MHIPNIVTLNPQMSSKIISNIFHPAFILARSVACGLPASMWRVFLRGEQRQNNRENLQLFPVKFCKIHRVHSVSHDACHNMVGLIMPISLHKMVGWDWWYGVGGIFFFGVGLSNFDSKTDSSFICL